jgi:hypothetical protein
VGKLLHELAGSRDGGVNRKNGSMGGQDGAIHRGINDNNRLSYLIAFNCKALVCNDLDYSVWLSLRLFSGKMLQIRKTI